VPGVGDGGGGRRRVRGCGDEYIWRGGSKDVGRGYSLKLKDGLVSEKVGEFGGE